MTDPSMPSFDEHYKLHRRFDRLGRLVGDEAMARLFGARVAVIGVGGVGSHAAVALARSGIGRLDLVDFDVICATNVNRQIQSREGTAGQRKVEVLADYIGHIHPQVHAEPVPRFYDAECADEILGPPGEPRVDWVVDAIDNLTTKCHLLATCRQRGIPVVSACGASGRIDPTAIRTSDLAATRLDPLAAMVRKILRRHHGFDKGGPWGIPAVYSLEPAREPVQLHYDGGRGFRCMCPGPREHHTCEKRRVIYGTAGFVTGAFGLACASVVVRGLSGV
jgi:tRNA A37 threonylcarbamoyladenosine dehydratase